MAYTTSMESAAHRHYNDAVLLQNNQRRDNAGYHFGLAAECAVKHVLVRDCGLRSHEAPWWQHFPDLRNDGLLHINSRQGAELRKLLEAPAYMQEWNITMRYAENGAIDAVRLQRWQTQANQALGLLL